MAICKTCGVSFEGNFCSNCGAKKEETVQAFCTACGTPLVPDARFCGRCGYEIGAAPAEPVVVAATPVEPVKTAPFVVSAAQDHLSTQHNKPVVREREPKKEKDIFADEILAAFGYTEEGIEVSQETEQAAFEESAANEVQTSSSAKNSKALRNGKKAFRIGAVCAAAVLVLVLVMALFLTNGPLTPNDNGVNEEPSVNVEQLITEYVEDFIHIRVTLEYGTVGRIQVRTNLTDLGDGKYEVTGRVTVRDDYGDVYAGNYEASVTYNAGSETAKINSVDIETLSKQSY